MLFAGLALAAYLAARSLAARRTVRLAEARRGAAEIAVAVTLARTMRPVLPVAVFMAAFVIGSRLRNGRAGDRVRSAGHFPR